MTRDLRLFVAIVLSPENQERLREPVRRLVGTHSDVLRRVPDGSAHITLTFMPHVTDGMFAGINEAMRHVAQHRGPIALELAGPRVLRARQDPRLVLLPVTTGAAAIGTLAQDLHRAITTRVASLDLSPAKGAHVTLARFRKHARASDGRAVEQTMVSSSLASLVLHEDVRAIRLYESTLTPTGPEYVERLTTPLGNES